MKKTIDFNSESKIMIKEKINEYFEKEHDIILGEIGLSIAFDFVIKEIGPLIYNKGIDDAYNYIINNTEDLHALKMVNN